MNCMSTGWSTGGGKWTEQTCRCYEGSHARELPWKPYTRQQGHKEAKNWVRPESPTKLYARENYKTTRERWGSKNVKEHRSKKAPHVIHDTRTACYGGVYCVLNFSKIFMIVRLHWERLNCRCRTANYGCKSKSPWKVLLDSGVCAQTANLGMACLWSIFADFAWFFNM